MPTGCTMGFRTARERVLPISGDKTDEEKILADMEAEDDDVFIEKLRHIKHITQHSDVI